MFWAGFAAAVGVFWLSFWLVWHGMLLAVLVFLVGICLSVAGVLAAWARRIGQSYNNKG